MISGVYVNREVYERVLAPTVPYGVETWGMRLDERRKLDVKEIRVFIEYVWSDQDG